MWDLFLLCFLIWFVYDYLDKGDKISSLQDQLDRRKDNYDPYREYKRKYRDD